MTIISFIKLLSGTKCHPTSCYHDRPTLVSLIMHQVQKFPCTVYSFSLPHGAEPEYYSKHFVWICIGSRQAQVKYPQMLSCRFTCSVFVSMKSCPSSDNSVHLPFLFPSLALLRLTIFILTSNLSEIKPFVYLNYATFSQYHFNWMYNYIPCIVFCGTLCPLQPLHRIKTLNLVRCFPQSFVQSLLAS